MPRGRVATWETDYITLFKFIFPTSPETDKVELCENIENLTKAFREYKSYLEAPLAMRLMIPRLRRKRENFTRLKEEFSIIAGSQGTEEISRALAYNLVTNINPNSCRKITEFLEFYIDSIEDKDKKEKVEKIFLDGLFLELHNLRRKFCQSDRGLVSTISGLINFTDLIIQEKGESSNYKPSYFLNKIIQIKDLQEEYDSNLANITLSPKISPKKTQRDSTTSKWFYDIFLIDTECKPYYFQIEFKASRNRTTEIADAEPFLKVLIDPNDVSSGYRYACEEEKRIFSELTDLEKPQQKEHLETKSNLTKIFDRLPKLRCGEEDIRYIQCDGISLLGLSDAQLKFFYSHSLHSNRKNFFAMKKSLCRGKEVISLGVTYDSKNALHQNRELYETEINTFFFDDKKESVLHGFSFIRSIFKDRIQQLDQDISQPKETFAAPSPQDLTRSTTRSTRISITLPSLNTRRNEPSRTRLRPDPRDVITEDTPTSLGSAKCRITKKVSLLEVAREREVRRGPQLSTQTRALSSSQMMPNRKREMGQGGASIA